MGQVEEPGVRKGGERLGLHQEGRFLPLQGPPRPVKGWGWLPTLERTKRLCEGSGIQGLVAHGVEEEDSHDLSSAAA